MNGSLPRLLLLILLLARAVTARKRLDDHPNGRYFTFCLGVAETQVGDPLAMYPQAEINAKAVRRHYELLKIEDSGKSGKSA